MADLRVPSLGEKLVTVCGRLDPCSHEDRAWKGRSEGAFALLSHVLHHRRHTKTPQHI